MEALEDIVHISVMDTFDLDDEVFNDWYNGVLPAVSAEKRVVNFYRDSGKPDSVEDDDWLKDLFLRDIVSIYMQKHLFDLEFSANNSELWMG